MSEQLKRNRTTYKGTFTRAAKSLEQAIDSNAPKITIEKRFVTLTEKFNIVQNCHNEFVNTLNENELNADEVETWISEICNIYDELEIRTDTYIEKLNEQNAESIRRENEKLQNNVNKEKYILRKAEECKFNDIVNDLTNMMNDSYFSGTKDTLIAALKRLQLCKNSCDNVHLDYIKSLSNIEEKEREGQWVIDIAKEYNRINNETTEYISRINLNVEQHITQSPVKIERIKFENFNGDLRRYPRFKEEFLKHIKPTYKSSEEAFVLKSYLEKHIREDVENLGEDATAIWHRLDEKYGNKRKLVDAIICEVKKLKSNYNENPRKTLEMINTVEKAHRDLKGLGLESEINNTTIVSIIEEKLPYEIEKEWIKIASTQVGNNELFPALLELLLDFKRRIEYKISDIRRSSDYKSFTGHVEKGSESFPRKPWCWLHPTSHDHPIWRCNTLLEMTPHERVESIKENKGCFLCLEQGHRLSTCRRNFKCKEKDCGLPHHTLLHNAHVQGITFHGHNSQNDVLLQLQRIRVSGTNTHINALWDGGSTLSFITFRKAKQLNLHQDQKVRLQIEKIGGSLEEYDSYRYHLVLLNKWNQRIKISVLGIERISNNISNVNIETLCSSFPQIRPIDINRPDDGEVDCLLGYDYAAYHPITKASENHLLLMENEFGKIIAGKHPNALERTNRIFQQGSVNLVTTSLEDFYKFESLGIQCQPRCGRCHCGECQLGGKNMTIKEEKEFNLINDKLHFDKEAKKWTAGLPWIKDPNELPNNKTAAIGALISCEKRLKKNIQHATSYNEQIQDMLNRSVAREISQKELDEYKGPKYYIPHHDVLKPDSKSTPLRIVFNSSAKFKGHILNDYLAKGPDMLNNLMGVLLRFREEKEAFVGDISKMYHSISIPIPDQMTQLFLWRNLVETIRPKTFAMTVVNFGNRPSGVIALTALQRTAGMYKDVFPEASRIITQNSYMDDIMESTDKKEKLTELIKQIEDILHSGGFKIKEWVTTTHHKQDPTKANTDEKTVALADKEDQSEHILGMKWNPQTDKISYNVKLNFSSKRNNKHAEPNINLTNVPLKLPTILTKRQILSQINRIYDPLGLISPFTIKGKIAMRRLWTYEEKIDWDDPIPNTLFEEWRDFFTEFKELQDISIPRCSKPNDSMGDPELIIFSDASTTAYGAVGYARWETSDGTFKSQLISSKNRIAPLKTSNIVRLELAGAVLGTRLRNFILKEARYNFKQIYHIVDSEIVKAMISKQSYGFNTFAANRVGEIQNGSDPSEWYWTPGKDNIADWVTRGKSPAQLQHDGIWQTGPLFLKYPTEEWPIVKETNVSTLPESKAIVMQTNAQVPETLFSRFNLDRFSKLNILINTTARIIRLYRKYKKDGDKPAFELPDIYVSPNDAANAKQLWIIEAQRQMKPDITKGIYRSLKPQEKNGILTVGGRCERWNEATYNKEEFILLPYNHRFSLLIADDIHKRNGHRGIAATVSIIRSQFWIIKANQLVKRIINKCVICKMKRLTLHSQIMSDLPIERLKPSPPFFTVGIDYFGPFTIRGEVQKRTRGKCYGVLITCFTSRAVYVDLSRDYSTDSFLQVLRRFSTFRGWPNKIYSDNGSQLVAASKELKETISNIDEEKLIGFCASQGTTWKFTTTNAPWTNGVTESMVKSIKKALSVSIGEQIMEFSVLQTVMFEAAELVNSRPIGRHPTSPDEEAYLCPNDLLLGRSNRQIPQGPFNENANPKRRYEFLQNIVSSFWKRWTRNYFPCLIVQKKWHFEKRNLQRGDLVLMKDINSLRGAWRRGIIRSPIASSDGYVRKVIVTYKPTETSKPVEVERPVNSLVVLATANDKDN